MACNKDLQAANEKHPRTCADCGIGKCTKYPDPVSPKSGDKIFLVIRPHRGGMLATFDKARADSLAKFGVGNVEEVEIV